MEEEQETTAELALASLSDEERALLAEPSPPGRRTKQWWDANPREREKARLRVQIARAQGRFTGRQGQSKKRPAYEMAAVKAAANGEKLAAELLDQALHAESIPQRQKAIELLFKAEQDVRRERRDEEDHLARLSGDALTKELMSTLRDLTGSDAFTYDIESTAEEVGEDVSDGEIIDAQEVEV